MKEIALSPVPHDFPRTEIRQKITTEPKTPVKLWDTEMQKEIPAEQAAKRIPAKSSCVNDKRPA
jgi:hypothetical protein